MVDACGELADSLQNIFLSVSSMVKSELQVKKNQILNYLQIVSNFSPDLKCSKQVDILEKMNLRIALEYDDLGDVVVGLIVFAEQMISKTGGLDEFVGQMDAIDKQLGFILVLILILI
ncbi:Biogenesis of lysosome-related organelles complex 1 subunit 2 [Cardamine amara subsp. amara]|uniref:Biogenesis of lysosome-related organelles complex 1 subunit 2 n=1 Tax=Cardamine amara subsp. amara TaxID=228776 RepID=A0ABD1AJW9_CARAN